MYKREQNKCSRLILFASKKFSTIIVVNNLIKTGNYTIAQ